MSSFAGSNEGLSMARPPLFKGTQFSWWKTKMEIFVNSEDVDLWDIIVEGPKEINNLFWVQMVSLSLNLGALGHKMTRY